jgi:hypothetical protein
MRCLALVALLFAGARIGARADALLPERVLPPAPFPHVYEEAPTTETIAPGVEYGDYQMLTAAGPLAVHVVAVQTRRSDVRIGDALADGRLVSPGETVGSMALRTGAVAAINGDYFDIGQTNEPENIVVHDGTLLHVPRKRYALAITRDGAAHIVEFSFSGQIVIGERTFSLDGIDQLAPDGGISLLTPEYGSVPPRDDVTLVAVEPIGGTPPLARYRVTRIADNLRREPAGYYIAIGSSAYGLVDTPNPGEIATVSGDLEPLGLDAIETAIGGGPLILRDGRWYDDPDGPHGGAFAKRIPCSGAAIAPDGRLFLLEVDGRQPAISVGLLRPEFAALMRAFGATDGLALDGGGSSTLVVRRLGESRPTVENAPSDGIERKVADALLVFSSAPYSRPSAIVARPGTVRAITGADVPLHVAAVDAARHVTPMPATLQTSVVPRSLGIVRDGVFTALLPGTGTILLRSGPLRGSVPVEVERTPARLRISPFRPNVERNGTLVLRAHAFDARGYPLALPSLLPWSSSTGHIDARGVFAAGQGNADIGVRVGDALARTLVTVGSHEIALPFAARARFVTVPHGGQGSLAKDAGCSECVQLAYSFSSGERAAYALADLALPLGTIGLSFDVLDDGSGARLRVLLRNAIDEDVYLDATRLDSPGWRHVVVRFPPEATQAAQAARLVALYVLRPKGIELARGRITIRAVRAVVAGE